MVTSLVIGRFQPFHLGHLRYIEYVLGKVEKVVIAIGSSQAHHSKSNPFTYDERAQMIRNSVQKIKRCTLVPVPDVNNDNIWVGHLVKLTPAFDAVYTNSPHERGLFEAAGFSVMDVPFFDKDSYCATNIRHRIGSGQKWKHLVPKGTWEVIEKIEGEDRIIESD